jgi:hypothetical protein
VPPDARLEDLRADYREMAAMMFDGDLTLRLQFSTVLHSGCATRWVRSREPAQTTAQSE